ncbi:hypothetical protein SDRG_14269 [Saprolegnia diclina VS20]|uniref:Secreted protein n=1 Tax=Saprolegnia diclina (strain VS20) TaxID=1156394 RepID=T0PR97_SAPDV|nr:hypothetical protein SDRG_14269 [Saprolegnia diclina VS20]EQC27994.1 hypothetical protein SDRG_14269 [Saprolegnia diclina VS20]|eukprot:XP_008618607.1 hypothetical protein SDRG_14269 [Saprolegnia diclina VS20]
MVSQTSTCAALLGAMSLVAGQTTTTAATNATAANSTGSSSSAGTWAFKRVRTVQARVQSDLPHWDSDHKEWVAIFPQNTVTFEQRYRAAMDTINTATVEGSLFYVQTEGIDKAVQAANNCMRKTNMTYIWYFDIEVVQPVLSVSQFGTNSGYAPEYGPFIAMDNGMCTPTSGTTVPQGCMQFTGLGGNLALGDYIGGEPRATHQYANYENNYWFSWPNSCFTQTFTAKTDACRASAAQKGGLCAYGTKPDGVTCTYSFSVLGYVNIDELVGITNMTSFQTGKPYANHVEFCKDGKYEWDFSTSTGIPFWSDPLNVTANAERSQKMMDFYTAKVAEGKGDYANMKPFPKVSDLTSANPSCSDNNPVCAKNQFGCKRTLLGQICVPCTAASSDCKAATRSWPTLPVATTAPPVTDAAGKIVPTVTNSLGQSVPATGTSSASVASLAATALLLVAFAIV